MLCCQHKTVGDRHSTNLSVAPQTFSFRPQQEHLSILEQRRFPGEEIGACINRLFRQLKREIEDGRVLQRRAIASSPQLERITFRPWPDVRSLVEEAKGMNRREKICSLIEMIPSTERVGAIATPREAMELLQELLQEQQEERILAVKAVDLLQERCAERYAREYLLLLRELGEIRLVQGHAGGAILGDGQYLWVELV